MTSTTTEPCSPPAPGAWCVLAETLNPPISDTAKQAGLQEKETHPVTTAPDPPPAASNTQTSQPCAAVPAGHDGDHHMTFQNVIARGEPRRTIYRGKR